METGEKALNASMWCYIMPIRIVTFALNVLCDLTAASDTSASLI